MSQKLKTGDRVFIRGWVMLKGLESGCAYDIEIREQFGREAVSFRRIGSKKVCARHFLDAVEAWIRDHASEDLNGILVERAKPKPVAVTRTESKMAVDPAVVADNPFGLEP